MYIHSIGGHFFFLTFILIFDIDTQVLLGICNVSETEEGVVPWDDELEASKYME